MEVYDMDKFSRTAPFALLNATRNRKKFAEILLVDYQLDPNLTDAYGKTVKQYATEKNDKELLKILNSINTPK
jgi:ankyrin repeat protein